MQALFPSDILAWGKNKDYSLELIYQFEPSYIEWAIKYREGFFIDVPSFLNLPKPTPFLEKRSYEFNLNGKTFSLNKFFNPNASQVENALKFIESGGIILNSDFTFSEETIKINELKTKGGYKVPHYTFTNELDDMI